MLKYLRHSIPLLRRTQLKLEWRLCLIYRNRKAFSRWSSGTAHPIMSREVWQELVSKQPKLIPKKEAKPKEADKSDWPKSIYIVGYILLISCIPASIGVTIVEQEWFRLYIKANEENTWGNRIANFLRLHFGPTITYHPKLEDQNGLHVSLEEERSFDHRDDSPSVRIAQNAVKSMKRQKYRVLISLMQNDQEVNQFCTVLDGSIQMNDEEIRKHLKTIDDSFDSYDISIDFLDEDEEKSLHAPEKKKNPTYQNLTSVYSAWHYFPPTVPTFETVSQKQIDISNLEYREKELSDMLNDVNCKRDFDEVKEELKSTRYELWKLKSGWSR